MRLYPERNRRVSGSAGLSLLLGSFALLLAAGIVYAPGEAFRASLLGLQIWWTNVFPGLLPPLILAELAAASGMLHGLATLSEPLVRRLFRLPGAAGWAIAFGWSAGIPAGAKETARLRENNLIADKDMENVLLVAHIPNPFLVILVVGGGFLHSARLGWAIAAGLWLSCIAAGLIWPRLTSSDETRANGDTLALPSAPGSGGTKQLPSAATDNPLPQHHSTTLRPAKTPGTSDSSLVRRAARAALAAREADGRPFGRQLADGVTSAVATLMIIGGLIMMSAVCIRLLQMLFPGGGLWLTVPGLYELHLGAYESGRSALFAAAPAQAAALLAALLAWTGWSGLLQARAAFGPSVRFPWRALITGRLLHSALALLLTYPLALAVRRLETKFPAAATWLDDSLPAGALTSAPWSDGWSRLPETTLTALASLTIFALLAAIAAMLKPKSRRKPKRPR